MRLASILLLASVGCATSPTSDELDLLGSAPSADGKSDEAVQCGAIARGETCEATLCGAKYEATDRHWIRTCAASDEAAEAFVKVSVTGAVTTSMDSRTNPLERVAAVNNELTNALHYGCVVLPESTTLLRGPHDGVTILIGEYDSLSWTLGAPNKSRRTMYVHTERPTATTGVYAGYAGFQENNEPDTAKFGGISGTSECAVTIATDDAGTVSGTFACDVEQAGEGTDAVKLEGEFNCPMNTLNTGIWSKLTAP